MALCLQTAEPTAAVEPRAVVVVQAEPQAVVVLLAAPAVAGWEVGS